ncbi:MAG: tetratricopeptide repeat protein [Terriglobales bacterium]
MKYVIANVGCLLGSIFVAVFLGVPLWLSITIFVVFAAWTNILLVRQKPSPTKVSRKSGPLASLISIVLLGWAVLDHHNRQTDKRGLEAFSKGKTAYDASDYPTAQKQFAESLAFADKSGSGEGQCKSAKDLGYSYMGQGESGNAEQAFSTATTNCVSYDDPSALVESYAAIGTIRQSGRDYQGADSALQKALDIAHNKLKPEDPQVAIVLNDLGALKRAQGNCSDAESLSRQALVIWEHALGPDGREAPVALSAYNNLGQALACEGKLAEAEAAYRKSETGPPLHSNK